MSTLAEELDELLAVISTLKTKRVVPRDQHRPTRLAAEKVARAMDSATELTEAHIEQVRLALIAAQQSGQDLSRLPIRLLRDAISLLWPSGHDGIDRKRLRHAILVHVGSTKSMLRRLIDSWLLHFTRDDDSFVDISRQIDRHLAADHAGMLAVWKEINRAHDLFDAKAGPDNLASKILSDTSIDILSECRLDTPSRANGGYLREIHFSVCRRLPKLLGEKDAEDSLGRAMGFFAPDGTLRFHVAERKTHGAMADALVAPWSDPRRQPSERMKSEVLAYLRLHLGDPRVNNEHRWDGASQRTRQTVRTWLSKLSLDAFFDVVGRFAGDAGMGHQWEARKAFWGACLREGHISDSWLVLGANVARSIADNRELRGSYGRLQDGNRNHSVLLIKIGNLVFSEWTFNGKIRAWQEDSKGAPVLFRTTGYSRSEVTGDGLQFPAPLHRPDLRTTDPDGASHVQGVWQGRVAALIRRKVSIALPAHMWRL
jgi:hypothetical protein